MIYKVYLLLISCWLLSACDTILENDLGLKDYPDQTVVNASLQVGGTAKVFISKSANILGKTELGAITNATVLLTHAGQSTNFTHIERGIYGSNVPVLSGAQYDLLVEIPGSPSIKASASTPSPFTVNTASGVDTLYISKNGDAISSFQVRWKDDSEEENFYEVQLYQLDSTNAPVPLRLRSNNLSIANNTSSDIFGNDASSYINKAFMTDALFNGKTINLQGQFIKAMPEEEVIVHIKSLTPEYYNYLLIQLKALEGQDELFTEPVTTPTNIEGAYGFMGGYYLVEKSI